MENLSSLNEKFGILEVLEFVEGPGGLVVIKVNNKFAEAEVALHGAHVMKFQPHGEQDILWMSQSSWFEKDKPIRGGIPVCWPWFGAHPKDKDKPSHGFVRISDWEVEETAMSDDGETRIVLALNDSAESREMWDYSFNLKLIVNVGKKLSVKLVMFNNGKDAFLMSAALHSYFNVSDITKVSVRGLSGYRLLNTVDNTEWVQKGLITFDKETDNIYFDTDGDYVIADEGLGRKIRISKRGSNSAVVWNPWAAKAARMPDFGDEEYHGMLCVETTNAEDDARIILPGAAHELEAVIGLD